MGLCITGTGEIIGVDGLWGAGHGVAETGRKQTQVVKKVIRILYWLHYLRNGTNDCWLPRGHIDSGDVGGTNETAQAWGALNVNENLSVSYGEREVEFSKASSAHVTEDGEVLAVAYTMGSMKIAGNMNEVSNNNGTAASNDEMTEIAISFDLLSLEKIEAPALRAGAFFKVFFQLSLNIFYIYQKI